MRFFAIFSNLDHKFSVKFNMMIVCNTVYDVVEVRPTKKILGPKFGPIKPKSGPKLGFLLFSQVWFISFPIYCIG